jgi:phosphoserine phosphatase RsbU/P
MKKMSLRNRILLYFLIVPLCAFGIAGVLTIIDMYELRDFSAKTGSDVANEAIHESVYAMHKEVHAELRMLANGQATICELQMRRALAGMNDLVSLYKDVCAGDYRVDDKGFVDGGSYKKTLRDDFTYVNHPTDLSQVEVNRGLRKLTMMRNAFKYSCAYDDYFVGMGIALPNGLFFKYDWFPIPLDYDVRKLQWFTQAVAQKGKLVWFAPTLSSTSNKLLLTFSQAVIVNGKVEAVIVIDTLPRTISSEFVITRGTDCFAFLIAPSGEIVAREDIFTKKLIWNLSPEEKMEFKNAITKKIVIGKKAEFTAVFRGEQLDIAFAPMSPGGWGVGVATPMKSISTAAGKVVGKIKDRKKTYILSTREYIEERILIYLGIGLLVLAIMLFFAGWIALHLGKPIMQLEFGVKQLGKRKLDEKIELASNDEFQELGETFNAMAFELSKQIKSLKDNIAQQERTKHELLVAAEIQQAMLPDVSLAFPNHDEFDIYAEMHPAKKVGGDFYDFFFVDEEHLFFAIGDISGKGLPAALFMMRSLTLLRHEAEDGFAPDEIFVNVGNELELNNDSCMFFTGTCGILNVSNGEVILSNGGHPPPYLRHRNSFDAVKIENGIIVGALPLRREQFSITKLQLQKGDTLFFYTDGVTEAFNAQNEEYQAKRLHGALQKLTGANPREILDGISKSITEFIGDAPQSDDITMLTIKYYA